MTRCVEMAAAQGGGLREQGPARDWQEVLDSAAAIRMVRDIDEAGVALYEVQHATGDRRLWLVEG
jgi:hypothetical protein